MLPAHTPRGAGPPSASKVPLCPGHLLGPHYRWPGVLGPPGRLHCWVKLRAPGTLWPGSPAPGGTGGCWGTLGGRDVQAGSSLVWPCVRPGPPIPRTGRERSSALLPLPSRPPCLASPWKTQQVAHAAPHGGLHVPATHRPGAGPSHSGRKPAAPEP